MGLPKKSTNSGHFGQKRSNTSTATPSTSKQTTATPSTSPSTPIEPVEKLPPAKPAEMDAQLRVFLSTAQNWSGKIARNFHETAAQEEQDRLQQSSPAKKQKLSATAKKPTAAQKRKAEVEENALVKRDQIVGEDKGFVFEQPATVTGGTLKDYQLRGVKWLLTLYQCGVNGILADEMGLGKTLQTIAFIASLRENGVTGPMIIICPLSVLDSWKAEIKKFTPTLSQFVSVYHGMKEERAVFRNSTFSKKSQESLILITTYDIAVRDANYLQKHTYTLLVLDEGHKVKNSETLVYKTLMEYSANSRLILTGTPIQNSIKELWSLLSIVSPVVFDDSDAFERLFADALASPDSAAVVADQLHQILRPFLLRRLKVDVDQHLPPKKEYLLHSPLTAEQKELYDVVVKHELPKYLVAARMKDSGLVRAAAPVDTTPEGFRKTRRGGVVDESKQRVYSELLTDDNYFEAMRANPNPSSNLGSLAIGAAHIEKAARTAVAGQHLQNTVVQLRKVCNHPSLFKPAAGPNLTPEEKHALLSSSGKMLLLNRLLFGPSGLFATGHKVILFSQFTQQLDIIQDWFEEKDLPLYRLDGTTKREDRTEQMVAFNNDNSPDAVKLFLLSTRAGGVGITLTGADTVIIFDSDWNPQVDLQAMDRAHRIGQTKPVLVFRLVTNNTVESTILKRANNKRQLEALVIGQGEYKMEKQQVSSILGPKRAIMPLNEIIASLSAIEAHVDLAKEGDLILSDEELTRLLDRSPETMQDKQSFNSTMVEVLKVAGEAEGGFSLDAEMEEELPEEELVFV